MKCHDIGKMCGDTKGARNAVSRVILPVAVKSNRLEVPQENRCATAPNVWRHLVADAALADFVDEALVDRKHAVRVVHHCHLVADPRARDPHELGAAQLQHTHDVLSQLDDSRVELLACGHAVHVVRVELDVSEAIEADVCAAADARRVGAWEQLVGCDEAEDVLREFKQRDDSVLLLRRFEVLRWRWR